MLIEAFNAIRSSQAETQELLSILDNSKAQILVVEDLKTLSRLSSHLVGLSISSIILLSDEQSDLSLPNREWTAHPDHENPSSSRHGAIS
jgi:long-chain acyl-CoA synthetase